MNKKNFNIKMIEFLFKIMMQYNNNRKNEQMSNIYKKMEAQQQKSAKLTILYN